MITKTFILDDKGFLEHLSTSQSDFVKKS